MLNERHPGEREDTQIDASDVGESSVEDQSASDVEWLSIARNTYVGSTDFIESSIRKQWEQNLYNFRSRHTPEGDTFKKRKMFRPKTRSSIRAHEAAMAAALFTNNDLISVEGANKNDQLQAKSAKLNQALLQHRLEKTIPWFTTVIGAYQDTHVQGICISKTYWQFEKFDDTEIVPLLDENGDFVLDDEGYPLGEEIVTGTRVISDKPVIDLIAGENFRFDPNADWRDPVSDSPYLIEMIPMYAGDVIEMMGVQGGKDDVPAWREYSLSQVVSAGSDQDSNSTRRAREGDRQDPRDIVVDHEFTSVWIHFNIYRKNGIDWAFYTIGTTLMLSDPVPLTDYFRVGRETYRVGFSTIEAHRNYPAGLAELGEQLQDEINTLADQRYENVRLVLNKRYFIRRQGNVDLQSLMRNRPGGGVMVDDPLNDVRIIDTPDVTSSSYAEQDRLNMDFDEMLGTFSPSTVQSNRSLNETVGGMNLMSTGANTVQEYVMRTFIETWVEPVLRTLVKLEQMFETDKTILAIAAEKAGLKEELEQQYGGEDVLEQYIKQNLTVSINVGMGNTNPQQKLERLLMAVNTTSQMPEVAGRVNWDEVVKEIYSFAGYGDGDRFLSGQSPQLGPSPEAQAEQAKAQARMQTVQLQEESRQQIAMLREQGEDRRFNARLETDTEIALMKLAQDKDLTVEQLRAKLAIEERKDKTSRDVKAMDASIKNHEAAIKERMGTGY
ncbi:MAG: hypothetical protein RQ714_06590 [Nitrosomonas sp.]|nr:hypothetical protein [Nitrosomonas sp.]